MPRFLIIEDEPVIARLLEAFLQQFGHVDVATQGFQALRLFRTSLVREPYTVIFLDILMPVLDGVELLALFRQLEPELSVERARTPVVVVSSLVDRAFVSDPGLRAACEGYLCKPVDLYELADMLRSLGVEVPDAFMPPRASRPSL